jgi:hypothetical protein
MTVRIKNGIHAAAVAILGGVAGYHQLGSSNAGSVRLRRRASSAKAAPGVSPLGTPIGLISPASTVPQLHKHLPAAMQEIHDGPQTAFGRLVETKHTLLARLDGDRHITTLNRFPTTLGDLLKAFQNFTMFYCDLGIPRYEVTHFVRKLLMMLASCDDRRFDDYEWKSWHNFLEAATKSQAFRDYLVKGLSRSLR